MILEFQTGLLDRSSFQDCIPWDSSKQVPEEAKVCLQGCDPAFCLVLSSQGPELHHLMVTAAKPALNIHVLKQFFLVCNYQIQQSISLRRLFNHLCQEVDISALQKPPGLLAPCHVAPPGGTVVVQTPHEDQGL